MQASLPEGRGPIFDAYVIVDWSANQKPKRGADSVWWVCATWRDGTLSIEEAVNPATRMLAREQLRGRLQRLVDEGASVLLGFDFAYGYPAGLASRLGLPVDEPWRAMWREVAGAIDDRQQDLGVNNRFEVAARMNRALGGGPGPFWGCPPGVEIDGLTPTKPPVPGAFRSSAWWIGAPVARSRPSSSPGRARWAARS
ncbi:hypothetical protein [Vulgatibacter incomptus]|uniref:Putative molybdopterin biosynthesis related methylmutase protein n=1 Tax=Vulgatibacter incomptus TaxID=1391653 RepID=A0A0K1PF12_9BACT|nr:hypothetical protein [Vulgatibacter incomptus]AKU92118.1 putative molybdopterin biosynthesis related methylmutase protein [Vulgatibacter incomptus]